MVLFWTLALNFMIWPPSPQGHWDAMVLPQIQSLNKPWPT